MSDSAAPSAPLAGMAVLWLLRALAGKKGPPVRLAIPHTPPAARAIPPLVRPVSYPPPKPAQWTSDRELVAWRAWRLAYWPSENRLYLMSLGVPWLWGGPVLVADHKPDPGPMNRSGVYAIKAPHYRSLERLWTAQVRVTGWVALSGRVIEHEQGYRAERAVIRRLRFSVGMHLAERDQAVLDRIARQLEDLYQAPVKMGWTERRHAQGLYRVGCRANAPAVVRCDPRGGWRIG